MFVAIAILLITVLVIERISLKNPLKHIEYSIYPSKKIVEPGEEFNVISQMDNPLRRPILFIEVQEKFPNEIEIVKEPHKTRKLKPFIDNKEMAMLTMTRTTYLMPHQSLNRRVLVTMPKRGRYSLWGASMWSGDFFGLREAHRQFDCQPEIVVVPKPADVTPELSALGGFLGSVSVRRFIMEDPVLTMGFREYTGQEPQKAIAWKQSARLQRLMVKTYDHTLEPSITVVLNVDCFDRPKEKQRLERCFSLVRSICEKLEELRIQYSFITNAKTQGAINGWKFISEGLGSNHLMTILEGLGRATYDLVEYFDRTADRAVRMAEAGRSHIIITPYETPALKSSADRIRSIVGGDTLIIASGNQV